MRIHAHAVVDATDVTEFRNWAGYTVAQLGAGDTVHIVGIIAHRADFLRRLAAAATQAADELEMGGRP